MKEVTQRENEIEDIRAYLGNKYYNVITSMTKSDSKILSGFGVSERLIENPSGSFLVEGSPKSLEKFLGYFLLICSVDRPARKEHMFSEFVEACVNRTSDDPISDLEDELLIIRCHGEKVGIGNTENFMESYVLSKVANRNRKGLLTLILAERQLPLLENSKELMYIDLVTPYNEMRVKTYIEEKKKEGGSVGAVSSKAADFASFS